MQPCKAAYKNCSQKSINFEKLCWVFLKIDGFPLEILSPNIPHSTDFASKSQISDEINSCSFCMCILRCFSERASKLHTSKGSSRRDKDSKIVSKKVPILPQSPKFLMRLINVLFACASSDVSRKELQSCTKQKEVQIEIKMAPKKSIYFASKSQISDEINSCSFCMCILRCFSERASKQHTTKGSSKRYKKCQSGPKKSTYFASYSQISNEGNSGVYLGTTLVPNLDDFLGGKLEKGFSPQCIFKLLLKWP